MKKKKIKILLADDQRLFVDGMVALLKKAQDIEVVGEVYDGEQVLNFLEKNSEVDIIVLDIEMPKLDGVQTTEIIRKKYPKIQILILSMYDKPSFILNLMKLGAAGYILKNKSKEELVTAIYGIHSGKSHYGLDVINSATKQNEVVMQDAELSERQEQVLIKIAEGYTTKQISEALFISEPTVNTHRRNLLRKINVPNDKFLVRYAIRKGYILA